MGTSTLVELDQPYWEKTGENQGMRGSGRSPDPRIPWFSPNLLLVEQALDFAQFAATKRRRSRPHTLCGVPTQDFWLFGRSRGWTPLARSWLVRIPPVP